MHNVFGSPVLTNVIFSDNHSDNLGGGLRNLWGSPTLINVTFVGNTATGAGGGVYNNASQPGRLSELLA